MAFSLEAIATVPLLLCLLLKPVEIAPALGLESIELARVQVRVSAAEIHPDSLYCVRGCEQGVLFVLEASPQIVIEAVTLAKDVWRPISDLLNP
jgi:hypothetical protein